MPESRPASPYDPGELLAIATRFYSVFRLAKVFEPNNATMQERLAQLAESVQAILRKAGEIRIEIRSGFLLINWTRLKFTAPTHHIFRFFLDEFMARQIGAVSFFPGLTSDELGRFMIFLARTEIPKTHPFETLQNMFGAAALPHVHWDKISPDEIGEMADKNPAPVFFLGIFHLQKLFGDRQGVWNFRVTKRWIQSICDMIALDESFLLGLVNLKNFEDYVLNHSVNVCVLSLALGKRIGLTRPELMDLGISAALHDVGKLDVPREILEKPAALDARERAVIERHSHTGANTLIRLMMAHELPIAAVQVALEHHVRADMNGYPRYVRRKRVNLFSRIVKITDYYDAITTRRVYRPGVLSPEAALRQMAAGSGTEFDALLFRAFARLMGPYPIGSLVALNTGEIAIVTETHVQSALARRPKIRIIADPAGRKIDGPVIDLGESDGGPGAAPSGRRIGKVLDADAYGIRVADYFLARAMGGFPA
ncbi:MAG: HD domain-containing phosphohydrolase [Candidatus Aminicenantales bacterium]|jgi:HD-GYP domain-containing protein (c-di-GMP phosphodiesterase class II)